MKLELFFDKKFTIKLFPGNKKNSHWLNGKIVIVFFLSED